MKQSRRLGRSLTIATACLLAGGASITHAIPRNMTGALGVQIPSNTIPNGWASGPAVAGKKQGIYPPTTGYLTVEVAGTTAGTFAGRPVTLDADKLVADVSRFRDFPDFPNVGHVTFTNMDRQAAATFMNGGGALAFCPGPGCFGNGTGTAISWCPPLADNPASPAPGTVGNPIGNWNCTSYAAPGVGNRRGVIRISNDPGSSHFGGVLSILRNIRTTVWRVPVQPSTPMANDAQVIRDYGSVMNVPWSAGLENFQYTSNPGLPGPRLFARLNSRGAVQSTFGCANGIGTVGQVFPGLDADPENGPFNPIVVPGNDCGTATQGAPPGQGWGFRMTTGTISGSDDFPFFDETTALGTPFNPNRVILTAADGFFFTRMGGDSVTGTGTNAVRNLVLLGGSVSVDPGSGNVFNRIATVRMRLQVPEPASALGLLVGSGLLLALARRRG
ncbi:MAG: PEP-CTERM sorting domain-containing protein [Myxococcota bacterium]